MAIVVAAVSPSIVPADGGYVLAITGTFPLGVRLNVHVGPAGTTADPLAYSGRRGQGSIIYALSATTLRVFSPVLAPGQLNTVLVKSLDSPDQDLLPASLQSVEPDYKTKVFSLRQPLPPFYKAGARNIEAVSPNGFGSVSVGLLEAITGAIGESDNESGGLVQTRLTAAVGAGDTVLPVETALGWAETGRVSVEGILYRYSSRTLTALEGLTHIAGGVTTPGAKKPHRQLAAVLDLGNPMSAIEEVRRALLVDFASGEDLNALGRNLGVFRLPFLRGDDQYRAIIKALAYNPKGTLFGLTLALDAMVGAGNFEISEDLVAFPNTVFIKLLASATTEDVSAGKTFLTEEQLQQATNDTTVPILAVPVTDGAIQGVRFKTDSLLVDATGARPQDQSLVEFEGDPGTTPWVLINAANPVTESFLVAGAYTELYDSTGTQAPRYRRDSRIEVESEASLSVLVTVPSTAVLSPSDVSQLQGIIVDQADTRLGWGIVSNGADYDIGFASASAFLAGPAATLQRDRFYEITVQKRGSLAVRLRVDGELVQELDYAAFASIAGADPRFLVGSFSSPLSGMRCRIKHLASYSRTPTDYWASRGSSGAVAGANPAQLDVNIPGHFVAGDASRTVVTRDSQAVNARGGSNNGVWEIGSVDSDEVVTLVGPTRGNVTVEAAFPKRIEVVGELETFLFPDDLGKKLVIEGSVLGNNGTYIIDKLFQLGTLVDLESFDTLIPERTNICEVVAASFVTEAGLSWHLEPDFVDETGLAWELSDAGSRAGTTLTLRQPLPPVAAGARVVETVVSEVLSAQVLGESRTLNRVLQESPPRYELYPFYVGDPLGFVRAYVDKVTAAGVIPDFKVE